MNKTCWIALAIQFCYLTGGVLAVEPNDTFSQSTVLAPGVLTVSDQLTAATPVDTILGARDHLGRVYAVNDDEGSPVGTATASGLGGVPTNSGAISFLITGFPDEGFGGGHSEQGQYEVFVDVYDFFEDPIDSFSEVRTLEPGQVHEFDYFDGDWVGGNYDVYINNLVGSSALADVDFFTFSGLTPGAAFTAETSAPSSPTADSYLGWFDDSGNLIVADDDGGQDFMSRLSGTVPNNGSLTFAVTGIGDDNFIGEHEEQFEYQLQVTIGSAGLNADFNNDDVVNGEDLAIWTSHFGSGAQADADDDGDTDGADFLVWQREFGATAASANTAAVPEPASALSFVWGAAIAMGCRRHFRRGRKIAAVP